MALTREQKEERLQELTTLLNSSQMLVFASYKGLRVSEAQELRRLAEGMNCSIRVTKNRLMKLALSAQDGFKDADTAPLKGQLLYGFSNTDEIAPAQLLGKFQKDHEAINLLGAIDRSGKLFSESEVKTLAALPSKEILRAQLVSTINAPLSGLVQVLAGNLRGLVQVLKAKSS